MTKRFGRRDFLAAGVGLGVGLAASAAWSQTEVAPRAPGTDALGRTLGRVGGGRGKQIPKQMAKTTKLFMTPPCWPNAIATDPQGRGFWVQEQRHDNRQEAAWLLDLNGQVLHKILTNSKDTSGMTFGDGYVWSGANGGSEINHPTPPINGIFQTDMNSRQIGHRQIPFSPTVDGGSCHGMGWQDGKLWIYANRLESLMRIDPMTWEVDCLFLCTRIPEISARLHGIEYDHGFIWQVCGAQKPNVPGYSGYTPGLVKYDVKTGKLSSL